MNRVLVALAALLLLAVAVPSVDAATAACTSVRSASCPGVVCVDQNGDKRLTQDECAESAIDPDPCMFRSDCCDGPTGFWCPERE